MGEAHARLGPSNHRWPNCPGSAREEATYPNDTNEYAIDGTGSHLLLELCLRAMEESSARPDGWLGRNIGKGAKGKTEVKQVRAEEWLERTIGEGHEDKPEGWYVKQDRVDRVQMALDYITRRRTEIKITEIRAETQSNPGKFFGRNDWWGTCDITIIGTDNEGRTIVEVIDYKDGRGFVSEKENTQLISYAGGVVGDMVTRNQKTVEQDDWLKSDILVRMTIVQPKTNPVIRYEDKHLTYLWPKVQELAEAAAKTDNPNAPLIPSPTENGWCRWCKHRGSCTASTDLAMEGVALMTDIVDGNNSLIEAIQTGEIKPDSMDSERISAILAAAKKIEKMIEAVKGEAMRRLKDGEVVPGYKLGTGNNKKKWNQEEEVIAKVIKGMSIGGRKLKKDEYYPAKFLTPAAALKLELSDKQRERLQEFIEIVPGNEKVVPGETTVPAGEVINFLGATEPEPAVAPEAPQAPISFM